MERKVVVVCAVVGFLGLLSAALSFAAEATRIKVKTLPLCRKILKAEVLVVYRSLVGVQMQFDSFWDVGFYSDR